MINNAKFPHYSTRKRKMPHQSICREINNTLAKYELTNLQVQPIDLALIPTQRYVQLKPESEFIRYLNALPKDRITNNGSFFRFIEDADRLTEILTTKKFRIYNLNAQEDNDFAEYTEMYRRLGHDTNERIEEARRDTYILCLAKEMHNERMWCEYTKNHGVSFRVKIHKKATQPLQWSFKDIYYDSGYDLDFYQEARFRVQRFAQYLMIPQISGLCHFYKRDKYRWENESRISIKDIPGGILPHNAIFANACHNHFEMHKGANDHNYILADLDNVLFEMRIEEVYFERNIDPQKYAALASACLASGIPLLHKE